MECMARRSKRKWQVWVYSRGSRTAARWREYMMSDLRQSAIDACHSVGTPVLVGIYNTSSLSLLAIPPLSSICHLEHCRRPSH